mgnify:CR=1 FL=1
MEESRLDKLEKELSELKIKIQEQKPKKEKKTRPPSDYNNFVKNFLADEKKRLGNDYNHKVAFKEAIVSWSKNKV